VAFGFFGDHFAAGEFLQAFDELQPIAEQGAAWCGCGSTFAHQTPSNRLRNTEQFFKIMAADLEGGTGFKIGYCTEEAM
jgi:hypothetical protein